MSGLDLQACRILVTGGTGFIGQLLVKQLCRMGADVTVLTRTPSKARRCFADDRLSITDFSGLQHCERFAGVINLAGATVVSRWSQRRRRVLRTSRVAFTQNLISQLNVLGAPEVLINGSAIGFYGDTGDALATEASPVGKGFAAELCRDWEAQAHILSELGTRVCLLRTGIVLDQGGGALKSMLPAFKLALGGPIASGKQWMSWIHRQDLVAMIIWLLGRKDISGPVNAVAPTPVSNLEFSQQLAAAVGRPAFLKVPSWALKLVLGQAAQELLLSSNRVAPCVAIENDFKYRYQVLSQALQVSV